MSYPWKKDSLHFIPIGGSGEFGNNLKILSFNGRLLIIDMGFSFANEYFPGIDIILPNIDFLEEHKDKIDGMLITHCHLDHIGALMHLWPKLECPIYATSLTAQMIEGAITDGGRRNVEPIIHEIEPLNSFDLGAYTIRAIAAAHSVPDSVMFDIKVDQTRILFTGDWKIGKDCIVHHSTDQTSLEEIGQDADLSALVADSTNVIKAGFAASEKEFYPAFKAVLERYQDTAIFVACQGLSALSRIEVLSEFIRDYGRSMAVLGRSIERGVAAAVQHGLLSNPECIISPEELMKKPRHERLFVITGTQAEPRAALMRLARGEHNRAKLTKDDVVVFSARIIPGNESQIHELKNDLRREGVHIVTNAEIPNVYITGHAHAGEAKEIIQWTKPKSLLPVHGDYDHQQAHIDLARDNHVEHGIIPENGDILSILPDGQIERVDRMEVKRLAVDGDMLVDADQSVAIRERRKIGYNGVVFVSILLDEKGSIVYRPEISLVGLAEDNVQNEIMVFEIQRRIEVDIERMSNKSQKNSNDLHEVVRLVVMRYIRDEYGKKPMIKIHICGA